MAEENAKDLREVLSKLERNGKTQEQLMTSIADSNKLVEQRFKQLEKYFESFLELVREFHTLHREQIKSLTERIDELEGLFIDLFEREEPNSEKIKYIRHGIKGVIRRD
ncbi:hypothetical protein [Heyndrickxia faecalis]|uniref:hypothetical protein n=1 Tax=Heyndrickxia faecalis TaxID=2824910 RepID=UPI003D205E37